MADKYIQIKDLSGNNLFPKTKGEYVYNAEGHTLEAVEAGAQVNKIEVIKVNGVPLQISSKEVDITVPEVPEYTLTKAVSADEGFSATYQLYKGGEAVGDKINIPKDMVVQSGDVKEVDTPDVPVEGYKVGDKYIDLVLANAESSHIYILVNDLVDVYTAGAGIKIEGQVISADIPTLSGSFATKEELANKADKADTLAGYGITDAYTKDEVDGKIQAKDSLPAQEGNEGKFLSTNGTAATWQDLPTATTEAKGIVELASADEFNTGTSETLVPTVKQVIDKLATKQDTLTLDDVPTEGSENAVKSKGVYTALQAKADKATSLAGYGITDAYTKTEIDGKLTMMLTYEEIL